MLAVSAAAIWAVWAKAKVSWAQFGAIAPSTNNQLGSAARPGKANNS